jgi:hypothetical protein
MQLEGLTTPDKIDQKVSSFCRRLSSRTPFFVNVQPELWCRQSTCEMNVQKLIEQIGGTSVIGYKVWYLKNKYIEAERHVIHEQSGTFRDPTFNSDGETTVLFVSDQNPDTAYDALPIKVREGFTQRARLFTQIKNQEEKFSVHLSNEESWERMLTYERWLAGERMANMWLGPVS